MIDHVNGDNFGISSSSLAAISGYPNITVPAGHVSGLPIGLSFIGKTWNEKQLIEIAYAFEQATKARQAPNPM
jgi:amidase